MQTDRSIPLGAQPFATRAGGAAGPRPHPRDRREPRLV